MKTLVSLAKEGKINEEASIKDSHSIIINAPIEKVWGILTNIEKWPEWNQDIKNVSLAKSAAPDVDFKWTFDGTKYNSQIQLLNEAEHTLAITGKSTWIKSVHVWQLENDDTQTIATLSASLQSFSILMNQHQKVYKDLLNWLERLKELAEA